jgi:hypothetical protein
VDDAFVNAPFTLFFAAKMIWLGLWGKTFTDMPVMEKGRDNPGRND